MLSYSGIVEVAMDPFALTAAFAVIGGLVTYATLRNHPIRRLVGQLVFLAALTALLLYHRIIPYSPGPTNASDFQRAFIGLAKFIWWMNAAGSLVSVVRVFLILEHAPREGRLIQDLVVGVIYVGAFLSVIAYVFNAPIGTLIATSGVFAIIVGLALQSTLNDVFSGIALNLSKPYKIGDWLVLSGGIEGQVVETNWRATHLLNGTNDLVVVPNSDLAKARLINFSSPERSHGASLTVRFRPLAEPAAMADVMRSALLSSNSIVATSEPLVQVTGLDSNAVELQLFFRVADMTATGKAKSEIFDLIYRHAKAAGLALSAPIEARGEIGDPFISADDPHRSATPRRLLDALTLFGSLDRG